MAVGVISIGEHPGGGVPGGRLEENRVEAEVQFRPRGMRRFSIEASIGDRLAGGVQVVWRLLY